MTRLARQDPESLQARLALRLRSSDHADFLPGVHPDSLDLALDLPSALLRTD